MFVLVRPTRPSSARERHCRERLSEPLTRCRAASEFVPRTRGVCHHQPRPAPPRPALTVTGSRARSRKAGRWPAANPAVIDLICSPTRSSGHRVLTHRTGIPACKHPVPPSAARSPARRPLTRSAPARLQHSRSPTLNSGRRNSRAGGGGVGTAGGSLRPRDRTRNQATADCSLVGPAAGVFCVRRSATLRRCVRSGRRCDWKITPGAGVIAVRRAAVRQRFVRSAGPPERPWYAGDPPRRPTRRRANL